MRKSVAFVFTVSVFVGVAGAGISLILPNQYTAKGLLVVSRKADASSSNFFTYEGSYAQQSAETYTTTFLSVLQSPSNIGAAVDAADVKKVSKLVKAKKEGSQSIVLAVKGDTPEQAQSYWNKIADRAIQTHTQLTANADPLVNVTKTPNSPVILKTYPKWQTVFGAGFVFAVIISSSLIVVAKYLKGERDN